MKCGHAVWCAVVLALLCVPAWAQSGGAWIDAIPEPQRAIEKISGKDELDTKSRQGAAIHEIARVILRLGGSEFSGPSRLNPREQALHKQYTDFYHEFSTEYANRLNRGLSPERLDEMGNRRPSAPFANLEYAYRISPTFQHQTFTAVMGEEWVTRWYEPLIERDRRIVADSYNRSMADAEASRARAKELNERNAKSLRARLVGVVIFVIGVAWTLLGWRAVRTDPKDPMRLTGRRRGWVFVPVTGFASDIRVYTSHKTTTTVRQHSDFRPNEVSSHTTSTHHCEFILNNQNGKKPVHLSDAGLQVGEGHLISCVWPWRGQRSRGMVLAYNHDTTQRSVFRCVDKLTGPRFLPGLVATLGVALAAHWSLALAFFLVFLVFYWVLAVVRARAFNKRDVPRIIERLRALEPEVSAVVGVGAVR
ncbi:MAG: hypothetical protein LAT64_04615 [Phycisphaerales bacterium]|nr:hypothetical protein [Phycisphaerales bacterium]